MRDNRRNGPPKLARILLKLFTGYNYRHSILDDFEETFEELKESRGVFKARRWYWTQVIKSLPGFYDLFIYWGIIMFGFNFKLIHRNIKKHKLYSFLNILGLSVGMTCFILIMFYIKYELSFDKFHDDADTIYRVVCELPDEEYNLNMDVLAITPAPLGTAAKEQFPEVEYATMFNSVDRLFLTYEKTNYFESGIYAGKDFFNIFSFDLLRGDINQSLAMLGNIAISERLANKFFGNKDPMGKTLTCSRGDFIVSGIFQNVPENSQFQFDWIIPFASQFSAESRDRRMQQWNWDNYHTYLKMKSGFSIEDFEQKLNTMTKEANANWLIRTKFRYFLQPLNNVHTTSGYKYELGITTDMSVIHLFTAVGIFILLIACINTMNLATANASKRAKEIGVRKVIGSRRIQLFWQFTGESFSLSAISFVIAVAMVLILLPWYNDLIDRSITIGEFFNLTAVVGLLATVIITGLLSGLYPAIFLSSMKPSRIFKQKAGSFTKSMSYRNILVLFQFSLTILFLIASMVVFKQLNFIKDKDLGFNRENVLILPGSDTGVYNNFEAFKNSLLQNPDVLQIAASSQLPIDIGSATGVQFGTDEGEPLTIHYQFIGADYNFIDLLDLEIVAGRNFSEQYGTDSAHAIIVNETFLKQIGWTDPIGKQVPPVWNGFTGEVCTVVGVVKDFNSRSLNLENKPVIIGCFPDSYFQLIRIRPANISTTISFIENTYDKYKSRFPFRYYFMDDLFQNMYQSEQKLGEMILYSNLLAIFIACLGIFGLSAFTAERRIKEIGIRKVLGASIPGIVLLLMKGLFKWILLANIISWPIAYYFANLWLNEYAYRTELSIGIFITAGITALFIAMLTVSYQAISAARSNPVVSLKYE